MSVRHFGTGKLTCRYVLERLLLGPFDSMGCILLRPISMPRTSSCMKTNVSTMIKGPILALLLTGSFIVSRPSRCAQAGAA